jgi:predicted ferric reductase
MSTLLIIANIFGYIGFIMLYLQVVFGSRHIFKYFTKNTVEVNKFHSSMGKYAILAVFLHPLLSMVSRLQDLLWIVTPNWTIETEAAITLGRIALFLFLAVWITSAIVRDKIKWDPWKKIHLLAYPLVFLIFPHMSQIGTFYENYVAIRFVMSALWIILVISIVYRVFTWAGIGKQKYKLTEKKLVGTDILLVTLQPLGKKVTSNIGQHFFLQTRRFGSEHPFSIIRNQDGTLHFGIRKVAGFWNEITKKEIGQTIFVDGPYGVFTREAQNIESKIIISAGIGVTPFIDLVENFGENTTYINCNRKIEEAVERDLLKSKTEKYFDIVNEYNGTPDDSIIIGQINEQIITNIIGTDHKTLPVFVCGSPGFIKAIKKMFVTLGTPKNNVYYEELGF